MFLLVIDADCRLLVLVFYLHIFFSSSDFLFFITKKLQISYNTYIEIYELYEKYI